jgi:hypothetical protein
MALFFAVSHFHNLSPHASGNVVIHTFTLHFAAILFSVARNTAAKH